MEDEKFEATHQHMANQGQTSAEDSRDTQCHFVCYVEKGGMIWELDGRLEGPICKGKLAPGDSLGIEASKIIQSYIDMNLEHDIKFNVMAMAPSFSEDFF